MLILGMDDQPLNTSAIPQPVNPDLPTPPKQNNTAVLFLSVLVLILTGVIIFLVFQNLQLKKRVVSSQAETLVLASPVSAGCYANREQGSDYLTYSHPKFKYSFDYPKDWTLEMAGWSQEEPDGFPHVSNEATDYKSITFSYFKETPDLKMDLSGTQPLTINNLEVYLTKRVFAGDSLVDSYVFKISADEFITVRMPVEDPNLQITSGSDDVVSAEKIINTFRLND